MVSGLGTVKQTHEQLGLMKNSNGEQREHDTFTRFIYYCKIWLQQEDGKQQYAPNGNA